MDLGIKEKVVLVTGATQGLGRACAAALAEEGASVIILARNREKVDEAVADLKQRGLVAHGYTADLTDKESVQTALKSIDATHGLPDILVYNNGGARDVYFDQASDEDFLHAYSILIMGFVWIVREVLPAMKQRGWGRIVTLGSLCAREPHREFPMVLHNLGRPAQVGLSKTLANSVGKTGVTINTIATGMIDHDGGSITRAYDAHAADRGLSADEIRKFRDSTIPVGRMGQPKEIGWLCAFLCSDRAGFINGQTVLLDGGRVSALM